MRNIVTAGLAALLLAACTSDGPAPAPELSAAAPVAAEPEAPGSGGRMPSGRDLGVRSAVVAPNGAAATAHPLATQTALDVLKAGGTAMDAAIAANAMLGLVEPTANGIGGDLFAIVWDPKTEKLYGYNGSGRSPMDATLADMQAIADKFMDGKELPPHGTAPVTVPGTVDAWYALHEKFGKRPMADNLQPAITYARNGAPIPEVIAYYWGRSAVAFPKSAESGMLEEFENARKTYFDPPPREGALFRNPDLADTLEKIAEKGRNEFYKGIMAKDMAAYFSRIGGHLDYDDFAAHKGEWTEPFCVTYREDYKVCELGPNTQGIAALQMLQILEKFDLRAMGFGSADSMMAQVEAKRIAFADRARFYADPAFTRFEPQALIDPARTERQSALIDTGAAMATVPIEPFGDVEVEAFDGAEADAKLKQGDTTYLTVTDKDGMMVSLIQSNYRGMGSGLVADGMGFMFQDRGQLFSLDPNHPNVWAPGKRPFHTIIP